MKKNFWRNALTLLLCLVLSGCTAGAPAAAEPTPTAEPTAAPTAEPTAVPDLPAEPTAAPTTEPTAAPTAEPEETSGGVTELQFEAMKPLFTAHILAQLNGMTYDQNSPEYFWQSVIFAIDGCGMDFYSAETFGSALVLSRGVIEEIASGLFEGGGTHLLEIPASLSGEIVYDKEADAFSHPLADGGFSVSVTSVTLEPNGTVWKITGELFADAMPNSAITAFSASLVQNTREGNSLFDYAIKELKIG